MLYHAVHIFNFCCFIQAKKKELSRLNRELSKAQAELNRQKRLRDDMGPQHIKLKESISTLKRQVRCSTAPVCVRGTRKYLHIQLFPIQFSSVWFVSFGVS